MKLTVLVVLLLGCSRPTDPVQHVAVVQVPTVDVRIAKLHRFADKILVNELVIWQRERYTCEKQYVFTDEVSFGDGVVGIVLKELHVCWRITYKTVTQPIGVEP